MRNSKSLFVDFVGWLTVNEPTSEKESIAEFVFCHLFDLSRTDIMADKQIDVTDDDIRRLADIAERINLSEPVQHILGEAEFFGRPFFVNASVLIPRPETEELVWHVMEFVSRHRMVAPAIVDIGCGSGCIPVTLACEIRDARVSATDISADAISVARENATLHGVAINFIRHDMLSGEFPLTAIDIITSNPPYIPVAEKHILDENVVAYEPHLALFVEGDDSLLFYRAIATIAARALRPEGLVIVEINERYGREVAALFSAFEQVTILKDINGKDRMVSAIKPIR